MERDQLDKTWLKLGQKTLVIYLLKQFQIKLQGTDLMIAMSILCDKKESSPYV